MKLTISKPGLLILFLTLSSKLALAQADSTFKKPEEESKEKKVTQIQSGKPNATNNSEADFTGVAVSPATLHLNVKPGTTQIKELKVSNDTKVIFKFRVSFSDFMMGRDGKTMPVKSGDSKYALSRWLSISPSYLEVKPGEIKKISLQVSVPADDAGSVSAWTIINVDEVKDKAPLSKPDDEKTMSIGVTPSFGFGVFVYQSPPNASVTSVEIQKVAYKDSAGMKQVIMVVKNTGDGIGYLSSYLELTNLKTGKKEKMGVKKFSILPGFFREFHYELPKNIPKGDYSALGVIDYGNEEDIKVAELPLSIK